MKRNLLTLVIGAFLILMNPSNAFSQCGPGTPTFIVDMTGNPSGTWFSPFVQRADNCCGTTPPDKCVKFIITLDPAAVAINFDICEGAVPPGALFYQINCGPPTPVGSPICLNGPGPHILTFCKPGNNQNVYCITSIPGAASGPDIVINDGCTGDLTVTGLIESTVTWTSIFPGSQGQYDNYLTCTSGCAFTEVNALPGYPPFVDYVVCGTSTAPCASGLICDTVRVTFNPTLFVDIVPIEPTVCFGQTNTTITAMGTGGTPPYNYTWNTGATTQSITVGIGTYTVLLGDASGCPPTSATVTVTAFANTITADASTDITTCGATNPTVTLNGSVTGTTTGVWTGGAGVFVPDNTTLNATYTPTAAELAAGSVTLTLSTTNNGSCPGASDQVTITYTTFTTVLTGVQDSVSCNGGSDGSATVNTTGGFPPYTYLWDDPAAQTTQTATGLPAGTYNVTVTDANGCIGTTSVTVIEPYPLVSNTFTDNVLCNGNATGNAFVQVFGGVLPYSYSWNSTPVQTTPTASGLPDGTFIVTIIDGNGCLHSDTVVIAQPPALVLNVTGTNVSCFGGSDGTATADVIGGTPPYSYDWSSSSTSPTANSLPAGSYSVTVTDFNGCTITDSILITEPPLLVVTVTPSNVTCFGANDGSASSSVSGGTPTYTYDWNPGTNPTVSGLAPGNYSLTVTDLLGCTQVVPFAIVEPLLLDITLAAQTNVSCNGGADGSASVAVTGGTLGYNYSWSSSGNTTPNESGLSAGSYTATVTDANGCVATLPIVITEPAFALSGSEVVTDVSCNGGSNGEITVTPAGGTSPYDIFWTFNGDSTLTQSGLAGGSYSYILTDVNGCTFTNTVVVNEAPPLSLTPFANPSVCSGQNGSGSVTASGGSGSYTYLWSPGGQTTSSVINVFAGSYIVYVTDGAGCMDSTIVNINDLTSATGSFSNITNVSCFGGNDGSVDLTVTSGFPAFTYSWTPSGSTLQDPTNLPAGANTVQITDGNGCNSYFTVTITQPPALTLAMQMTPVTCFGGSDGTATAFVTGGTPTYNYSWTPAAGAGSTGTGFSVGNANVLVTDANGCTITGDISITEPVQTTVSITSQSNVSCFGGANGSATAQGANGVVPYTYLWTPGNISGQTANGLAAGTYTVTSTDANGCIASTTVTITEPATPVSVTATSTGVLCNGGSTGTATGTGAGGTGIFSYSWNTSPVQSTQTATGLAAGTYVVTATDANGCNASVSVTVTQPQPLTASIVTGSSTCGNTNGSASAQVNGGTTSYSYLWTPTSLTTASINNVASGAYTVNITDANGCTTSANATVINIPGPTVSIASTTNVLCFGNATGSATASISSGTAPFQVSWLPLGGTNLTASNLPAGTYSVTITDANGCQAFTTATITEPTLLNPSILTVTNATCNGFTDGAITSTTSGGAGGNVYSWSPSGGSAPNASNLGAGTYTLTVTDANGCVSTASTTVTEPPVLTLNIVAANDPNCFGGSDGSIQVIAGGGTPNYTYVWNTTPVQSGPTATGLPIGTYTATVTDVNGCVEDISATLSQPTQVVLSSSPNDTICLGQSTVLTATGSGGNGPYTYVWNPNLGTGGTQTVSPTTSTTYTVTVYDNFGCQSSTTNSLYVEVYTLSLANFNVFGNSPICPGTVSTIYAAVSGNTGPVTYTWNQGLGTGAGAFSVYPTTPTYYICTATNNCGLTVTDSILVDMIPLPTVSFFSDVVDGCAPLLVTFDDQTITNTADSIYSWVWDFGNGDTSILQNPSYYYPTSGTYNVTLTVTTYGGCQNNSSANPYTISVYPVPDASFTLNQYQFNIPGDVMVCTNTSTGAVDYLWTFGDGYSSSVANPSHEYSDVGDMTVTLYATNQYGCIDTAIAIVDVVSEVEFPNAFTPNTNGPNGGSYTLGDLTNDVFFPYTTGVDNFKMWIFNRWGELIFESDDISIGWDGYYRGELCEQGVYVWKAEVVFQDGRKYNKVGDVTLLR